MTAIPLTTTDLSCGRGVKDLTYRRYADEEMTAPQSHNVFCPGSICFDLNRHALDRPH